MKRKINIVKYKVFQKVNYYSLQFEQDSVCETDEFKGRFESGEHEESFNTIQYWLAKIGHERGARKYLFRKESITNEARHNQSVALPPDSEFFEEDKAYHATHISPSDDVDERSLRLYCIWLSESVVVLYNGDVKTANDVRNCKNCYPFFKNTNKLSSQIHTQTVAFELVEKRIKYANRVELEL